METEILIDGKKVKFRATAAVPRLYRIKFRRDIIQDMATVKKVPESPNEWLEEFSAFSIYKIFPVLLALWDGNIETIETVKKKLDLLTEK